MQEMIYRQEKEDTVLADDVYRGYRYVVKSYGTHPCGYVRLNGDRKAIDTQSISCHGGITFRGRLFATGEHWIGWDYNHGSDYSGRHPSVTLYKKIWATEEIVDECRHVIDQVIMQKKGADIAEKSNTGMNAREWRDVLGKAIEALSC